LAGAIICGAFRYSWSWAGSGRAAITAAKMNNPKNIFFILGKPSFCCRVPGYGLLQSDAGIADGHGINVNGLQLPAEDAGHDCCH
jgi:hypothetical protein